MLKIPAKFVDPLNIILIIITCILAHLLPYQLLIFSYAVLGPAHYLTQISWLHDRRYFANSHLIAPAMGVFSIILLLIPALYGINSPYSVAVIGVAVFCAFLSVLPRNSTKIQYSLIFISALSLGLATWHFPALLLMALLIPTVIHVFVFTLCFMWVGAKKSQRKSAYFSFFVLLAGGATFLVLKSGNIVVPDLIGISYFRPVVKSLQKLGLTGTTEAQLFGFLSFAYTYHYLNWFSKTEIIHWDRIPHRRMKIIIISYLVILATFAIHYSLGFLIAILLSFIHVLLEFPLNLRTFRTMALGKD